MRVKVASLIAVLSLVMVLAPATTAGGWATAAVIGDLKPATAGEPFTIRYVVRAHGMVGHELAGMKTSLKFRSRSTKEAVESAGTVSNDPKVYEATITLPVAGAWKWTIVIHDYLPDQVIESPMPTLTATVAGQPVDVTTARASGMTTIITVSDNGFSPSTLEVNAGDTITWVNEGQMAHQVASDALGFETSPMIQPGDAFYQTFVEPGSFDYLCPPHPSMVGTIVVT